MRLLVISGATVAVLVVLGVLDLFAIIFGLSFRRARQAERTAAAAIPGTAPPKPKAVSRRDFFRHSLLISLAVFGAQFGGASLAFLWPNLKGGFGSTIAAGSLEGIKSEIQDTGQPAYNGAGRFYLVRYGGSATDDADYVAVGAAAEGIMPLYQRCPHLGCRVPFCVSSRWFECPCHGSKYNGAGEYQLGPAPRGLDRFPITVDGGNVFVDTAQVILGPSRGTDTISQPAQGPFCV
ncbi:MAG TPA: Rieske 2Fe-2S domain-containing protein [Actinomycetota bacterium]|nr:Rieske 2Fe-2S domain-containing protein [Actinomycetota bacterium]